MVQRVKDEDGSIHEFPDDASPDEINASLSPIKSSHSHTEFNPSFGEKLAPNIVVGLANMGHGILNSPSNLGQYLASKGLIKPETANKIPRQQDYDYADLLKLPKNPSMSDKIIRELVQQSPAILAPEMKLGTIGKVLDSMPYAGKLIRKIIGNAIPVGAFETTQSDHPLKSASEAAATTVPFSALQTMIESKSPLIRMGSRLALAGAGAYGGYNAAKALGANSLTADVPATIIGGLLAAAGKNAKIDARDTILKGVNPADVQEKLAAAKRLNLSYITPAEASGNPFVAATQGATGKTEGGSQLLYERGKERLASEKKAINDFYDTVFDEQKLSPKVDSLYKQAYQKNVPQNFVDSLKNNEIFKTAINNMNNKSAYKESLKGVPDNSIAYLDHVKQSLDDMIEAAPKKEARILKNTQKKLVNEMDNISPEYAEARGLAEREITKNKLQESLNEFDERGTNFFNKILKNDKNFNKVRHSLRNVPTAQQKLDDMKLVFRDFINPPTPRTAAGLAKTGMTQNRNTRKELEQWMLEKIHGSKFDKEAVELMTNPNWDQELHNIGKISNTRERASKGIQLMGRVSAALKLGEGKND